MESGVERLKLLQARQIQISMLGVALPGSGRWLEARVPSLSSTLSRHPLSPVHLHAAGSTARRHGQRSPASRKSPRRMLDRDTRHVICPSTASSTSCLHNESWRRPSSYHLGRRCECLPSQAAASRDQLMCPEMLAAARGVNDKVYHRLEDLDSAGVGSRRDTVVSRS